MTTKNKILDKISCVCSFLTSSKKFCGNVLEKTPLARGGVGGWGGDGRRCVDAFWRPDGALGVVGGRCTKEVDENGNHKDGNPRHNNEKMELYLKEGSTADVYWD